MTESGLSSDLLTSNRGVAFCYVYVIFQDQSTT
jgi:hypothetical protein